MHSSAGVHITANTLTQPMTTDVTVSMDLTTSEP